MLADVTISATPQKPRWGRLIVGAASFGGGFALVVFLVVAALTWYKSRPKPWNATAIKAQFKDADIYLSDQKQNLYSVSLEFDLTNTTDRDYTLPPPSGTMTPMEMRSGSLISAPGLEWFVETGITPYALPADFFEPKPILVPPHETVRVRFLFQIAYSPEITRGKNSWEIAKYDLREVNSFVLLDSNNRYRLELPLESFHSLHKGTGSR